MGLCSTPYFYSVFCLYLMMGFCRLLYFLFIDGWFSSTLFFGLWLLCAILLTHLSSPSDAEQSCSLCFSAQRGNATSLPHSWAWWPYLLHIKQNTTFMYSAIFQSYQPHLTFLCAKVRQISGSTSAIIFLICFLFLKEYFGRIKSIVSLSSGFCVTMIAARILILMFSGTSYIIMFGFRSLGVLTSKTWLHFSVISLLKRSISARRTDRKIITYR